MSKYLLHCKHFHTLKPKTYSLDPELELDLELGVDPELEEEVLEAKESKRNQNLCLLAGKIGQLYLKKEHLLEVSVPLFCSWGSFLSSPFRSCADTSVASLPPRYAPWGASCHGIIWITLITQILG